jgi:uncharacterized membrane protein
MEEIRETGVSERCSVTAARRLEAIEMTIATFGLVSLIGATLGFRFKVLILFPAIGIAFLSVAAIGIGRGDHGHEMILTMILIAVSLQIGYLVGIVARTIVIFLVPPAVPGVLAHDR